MHYETDFMIFIMENIAHKKEKQMEEDACDIVTKDKGIHIKIPR